MCVVGGCCVCVVGGCCVFHHPFMLSPLWSLAMPVTNSNDAVCRTQKKKWDERSPLTNIGMVAR